MCVVLSQLSLWPFVTAAVGTAMSKERPIAILLFSGTKRNNWDNHQSLSYQSPSSALMYIVVGDAMSGISVF